MKKLVLVLLAVFSLSSCSEQGAWEDDGCNSDCWTVVNKKDRLIGDNVYEFSIKISRNCSNNSEWKRVYLNNTSELAMYELGDVLCGNEVPQ